MNMDISISSPVLSPQFAFYSPSDGQGTATWIDANNVRSISEHLWKSKLHGVNQLFSDFCDSNGRLQWNMGIIEEDNGFEDQSSDEFRMYKFKVVICMRDTSHDWTRCPFAHRGERARRRHPSLYCGETCVNYKKGYCRKGLTCEFAHGLFESWLHPHRYRTKRCKDGVNCNRRVCFFAHRDEEIRFPSKPSSSKMKDHKNYSITPRNRSACTNVAIPQIYNAISQDVVGSPRGAHAALMLLEPLYMNSPLQYNSPSPSSSSVSSGSFPGSSLGSPGCDVGDVVTAFRNVGLQDEIYKINQSVSQNHVNGDDQYSSETGVHCGLQLLGSGKKLRAEIYRKFWKDQIQKEYNTSAADQPDIAWVSELVEEPSKTESEHIFNELK